MKKSKLQIKNEVPAKSLSGKKKFLFYSFLITFPFLILTILEITLRLLSYGYSEEFWIEIEKNKITVNPEFTRKYFYNKENIPFTTDAVIDKVKKENSIRFFFLGESSAAGYPYNSNGSFAKYIRKYFELKYPDKIIEAANFSMAAINSYTIYDIVENIIDKSPDLIIIYTGHNEYYGALGAASSESLGRSPGIVKLMLWLNNFKTTQLLRNLIASLFGIFESEDKSDGTLMATMAEEQLVEFDSETFHDGLHQFQSNMQDILSLLKDNNIPVIIGTLASNIRDQKPFYSIGAKSADQFYKKGITELDRNNYNSADSLLTLAKEYDALRFRAPEIFNEIINNFGKNGYCYVADIGNRLSSLSKYGIIGNDMMTDHLHPNLDAYKTMGKLFIEEVEKNDLLKLQSSYDFESDSISYLMNSIYYFTKYDSIIADMRIKILKNDWPYVQKENRVPPEKLFSLNSFEEEIAYKMINNIIPRNESRIKLIEYYKNNNDSEPYLNELGALSDEFQFITEYAVNAGIEAFRFGKYFNAFYSFRRAYNNNQDSFNSKWLGITLIYLNKQKSAVKYLLESLNYDSKDVQTLYNLSVAYFRLKDYKSSMFYIEQCLEIKPDFQSAVNFKLSLNKLLQQNSE